MFRTISSIGVGFADESALTGGDVYSGNANDPTPEVVEIGTTQTRTWSVMAQGWVRYYNDPPMNGSYGAFSLEELMTIDSENVDCIEG